MSTEAPQVECPNCGKTFEVRDAFELDEGGEIECGHCGKELVISEVECIRRWEVSTKADYDAYQARRKAEHDKQIAEFLARRESDHVR